MSDNNLAFGFIPLPVRPVKPRDTGVTMVLDKGLSVADARELVSSAGPYIDLVKLGWGTARLMPRARVAEKVQVYLEAEIEVCPGGTFLEVAAAHGLEDRFFEEALALGFSCIEVSDGVLEMGRHKLELISQAKQQGFRVVSEVGRKSVVEDARLSPDERVAVTRREIDAGAWKVVMEGRESGTVGMFDDEGDVRPELIARMIDAVGFERLLFEAPLRSQQAWFISNCGGDVNLGNVAPADAIAVETLRTGLRGDTLLSRHVASTRVTLALGPGAALQAARDGEIIVVIDALRASSTIVAALAHGVRTVRPVASVAECVGDFTAGERGGRKIAGLTLDNSPLSFVGDDYRERDLVLTTTNGTECIAAAASGAEPRVLVGTLLNVTATARYVDAWARREGRGVTLLVAGRNNDIAVEDVIAATEIAAAMPNCPLRGDVEPRYSSDFPRDFLDSESGRNLVALGRRADVLFCAQKDRYDLVPVWRDGVLVTARPAAETDQ